jgi:hypothetical protein
VIPSRNTPVAMTDSADPASLRRRPLTVTEWSRDWAMWIVSARLQDDWTLVGVFESSDAAFEAADRAAERLRDLAGL